MRDPSKIEAGKTPEIQSFERAFDKQSRAGLRYVDHLAIPPPSSINSHHVNRDATFEIDALALSISIGHYVIQRSMGQKRYSDRRQLFLAVMQCPVTLR